MSDLTVIRREDVTEAFEDIGELVSQAGGEGDEALDLLKGLADEFFRRSTTTTGAVSALKARLRQEVDAGRAWIHPHALPLTDEEWLSYLSGIPGLGE